MSVYLIYRATNKVTGEIYIGFTSQSVTKRSLGHKRKAFIDNSMTKFHRALRKYGWDSFEFESIYESKESLSPKDSHTCKVMEDYFITEYDSINNGYNMAKGGGEWPIMCGEDHPLYEVGHSEATCKKIRDNHHDVSGSSNPRARQYVVVTPDMSLIYCNGNIHEVSASLGFRSEALYSLSRREIPIGLRGKIKRFQVYDIKDISKIKTKEEIDRIVSADDLNRSKLMSSSTRTCEYCGITTCKANHTRWHGDNCKLNPKRFHQNA